MIYLSYASICYFSFDLINEQNLSASVGDITLEGQSDQEGDRQ
jgi:hypothetical protein